MTSLTAASSSVTGWSLYDLQRPDVIADPWPWYAGLRAAAPVYWDRTTGTWLVTRHADVAAVLAEKHRFTVFMGHRRRAHAVPAALRPTFELLDEVVALVDAPDHTRLRTILAGPFSPARTAELQGWVAGLVTAALDRVSTAGRMEVVADLAARVPLQVIAGLLGLDDVDLDTLRRWSAAFGALIAAPGHLPTGDTTHRLHADLAELLDGIRALIAAHRTRRRDTITGALVAAADAGQLSEAELVGNLLLLLAAGNETTAGLIANAVAAVMRHRWLADRLRRSPQLLPAAVDELARLGAPNQYTVRTAATNLRIGGQQISAGQSVVLMLAAANRDPDAFGDPDAIRLDRPATPRPLGFGHGAHYCFGAPLARLETRLVLAGVLARCPGLRPDGPPWWRGNANLRGLAALPVRFRARTAGADHTPTTGGTR